MTPTKKGDAIALVDRYDEGKRIRCKKTDLIWLGRQWARANSIFMSQYETRWFRSRGTLLVSYFALLITQISVAKNFVHKIQNGANAQQV